MAEKDLKTLFVHQLKDTYFAENAILKALMVSSNRGSFCKALLSGRTCAGFRVALRSRHGAAARWVVV